MKGKVVLSARMQAVADMVSPGNRVADVGCDHGYVSIYLIQQRRVEHVIAMDVNKGPLQRAWEHVEEAGLLTYITLRLSDGLLEFQAGEADSLICAGMGGRLIQRILLQEPEKTASFNELILQPQSELKDFRFFLADLGYCIVSEDMIREEGKFYPVIKAVKGREKEKLSQEEARFGPVLLKKKHPILKEYLAMQWQSLHKLEKELSSCDEISFNDGSSRLAKRRKELLVELECVKKAAECMGMEI